MGNIYDFLYRTHFVHCNKIIETGLFKPLVDIKSDLQVLVRAGNTVKHREVVRNLFVLHHVQYHTASSSCTRSHSSVFPFLQTLSRLMSVTAWLAEYWCLWTAGPADQRRLRYRSGHPRSSARLGQEWRLTLHQVLVVNGGQVGEVLLQV